MRTTSILLSLSSLSAILLTHALPTATTSTSSEQLERRSSPGSPFWWQPSQHNSGSTGIGWNNGGGNNNNNNNDNNNGGGGDSCTCKQPTPTGNSNPSSTSGLGNYLPFFEQSQCSMSNVVLPTAPTPLPAPRGTLMHVAVGRGTQNYTCDMSSSSSVPVQIGALATLYNATCLASTHSSVLSMMPGVVLNFPFSKTQQNPVPGADALISGHHFFTGPTNPTFDMDTSRWELGIGSMSKKAASSAPASTTQDKAAMSPYEQEATKYGNAPWLYLVSNTAMPQDERAFTEVYRVNTIGGVAPATCAEAGQAVFQVEYAAEYWFFQ